MLNLITTSISIFVILLTGWTLISYFEKKDSQKAITKELSNLFDIIKKFFLSLKNLIRILASSSLSDEENKATPLINNVLKDNNQPLNLVQDIKEIKDQSLEVKYDNDNDDALSSFSQEVVDVINEEEEKAA